MKPVSVLRGDRQYDARVERDGDEYVVTIRGRSTRIRVEDPREWSASTNGRGNSGVAKIASPMPGKVVRVLVAVGDEVKAGQGIVVVEAMKMQNEMKSPLDGVVKQVMCEEGETVNANKVLVVVEAHAG